MTIALKEAQRASREFGCIPVAAAIVKSNSVVALSANRIIRNCDPTAHAEIISIRDACKTLNTHVLSECDIYVTLEPCPMCAYAISLAKIRRVYFGAYNTKCGGVEHGPLIFNHSLHKPELIGGIFEHDCSELLTKFFQEIRK